VAKKAKARRHTGKKVPSAKKKSGKIWVAAVDPFAQIEGQVIVDFAKHLAEKSGATVQPTYVLAPASLNWTGEFSGPWLKKYLPLSEARMAELFGEPSRVVTCKDSGQRAAVKALVSHAQRQGAECVLISTHARKGLERLALGSFAETLILVSKIPVVVMNPSVQAPNGVRKILVPTDLSRESAKFVMAVTEQAQKWGAEIVLFYKQPDPLDPIIQQGVYSLGGGWVSVQSFVDAELARKREEIGKLERMVAKAGVSVRHIVDSSPEGLIESINQAVADEKADMVAVLTKAGPLSSALLGSVARALVRESRVPVMVRR
jgi:nucleotide-binding universal stress UspA family protein